MPSSETWRYPLWVPLVIIAVAALAIFLSGGHLMKRTKARWPW